MYKSLITGITGSGGSYLAEYILDNHKEAEVHGTSRSHSGSSNKNIEAIIDRIHVHECDLTDFGSVLSVLEEVNPKYIFHMASNANVRASFDTPLSFLNNNIMGTANLLDAVRRSKINPKIQLCSTSEVYGKVDPKNIPINEDCPMNPANPYAVSKATQDFLGNTYFLNFDLQVIRTRMFSYINPRRENLFATSFALQVAKIEEGLQEKLLHGNLDSTRTLIDVRDAMKSYWIATTNGRAGEVYNIGGEKIIKVGEFLEVLKDLAKCKIPSEVDPNLLRPTDVTLQIPDCSKFKRETGWEPEYPFEESVQYLLDHCRKKIRNEKNNFL